MHSNKMQKSQNSLKNQQNPYNKYLIKQMIGQGQIGKVYKAYQLLSPQNIVAIKIIPMNKLKSNPKLKQLLKNEIQILCTIEHPNIIKFQQIFCWEHKVYMVYQYCDGGSLQDAFPISLNSATYIFQQIINACQLAERNSIMHRDLKPANILFKNKKIIVADWGFSKLLEDQINTKSVIGSPAYMAPQLLRGQKYTNKADVWSFGVMMYECLTGKLPWSASNVKQLKQLIRKKIELPKNVLGIHRKILKGALEYDAAKRFSFKKIKAIFQTQNVCKKKNSEQQLINPQQQIQELNEAEIKLCTYYLQFTKESEKFENQEVRGYCLDYILNKLIKLRFKKVHKSERLTDRFQLKSVKTENKFSRNKIEYKSPKSQIKKSETYSLLDKQITLIQKLRNNSSSRLCSLKIKQIIQKVLYLVDIKIQNSQRIRVIDKHILIQMNCFLNVLLCQHTNNNFSGDSLVEDVWQLQKSKRLELLDLLSAKILYLEGFQ